MSVTWRDRLRCWLRGSHRYETTRGPGEWPNGFTYRLCRTCGATKGLR